MKSTLSAIQAGAVPAPGDGFGDADYAAFQQKVLARTGIRLGDYKQEQMRRRIGALAHRAGYPSFQAYFAALERRPAEMDSFRSHITINVSELLRNPERFDDLARAILPELIARLGGRSLALWSAGCSYGAEAFSLAMLLREAAPAVPYHILGTDIDERILDKASAARFTDSDMANVSPERRAAHFVLQPDGGFAAAPALRAGVRFDRHDLLVDPIPMGRYDLITCRNVVIYFTDSAKERLYRKFRDALRPGGILFVGGTERLPNPQAAGYEIVLPFFYRKPLF